MPKFVSLFIDRERQGLLSIALWILSFAIALLFGAGLWSGFVSQKLAAEAQHILEPRVRSHQNITSTFLALKTGATALPCSPAFHEQLREIAFLPDGLNEFIYAPQGVATCSVEKDFPPYDLGEPDAITPENGLHIWYDHPLDFLGRPGLSGSILLNQAFGIVVPPQPTGASTTDWIEAEEIHVLPDEYFHRSGEPGIYTAAMSAGPWGSYLPIDFQSYYTVACLPTGRICIATRARLSDAAAANASVLVLGVLLSALLALGISGQAHAMLRYFWSFEARFLRHFKPHNLICHYQPILDLRSGRIKGCEVLVRWRDVDGATVFPDRFLPLVEKSGLGRKLTEYVVARTFEELSTQVPADRKLQVNINIFPHDVDSIWLRDTLSIFKRDGDRFDVVVEIVETDQMHIMTAQHEIKALCNFGFKTHLDDFGTGYSNIENLARLPIDGVKLDRSFAMSAEGSLMSRLLANAIEMVSSAGHRLTVEGVETDERLAMLKATGQVDFVQGYLISRPLDIGQFVQFLSQRAQLESAQPLVTA